MNELKFLMVTKFIGRYEENISDFFSMIKNFVKYKHDAEFFGDGKEIIMIGYGIYIKADMIKIP